MVPVTGDRTGWSAWSAAQAEEARGRYAFHRFRTERASREDDERLAARAAAKLADLPAHTRETDPAAIERKRAVIEAALRRARARRGEGTA
jgi:electron transport complex protein RnfB